MENKIPLPTDNIFKFYALFGLMLFVTSLAGSLYLTKSTNALLFQGAIELEGLNLIEKPSSLEKTKKDLLERKLEIAIEDKKFLRQALGVLIGLSIGLMIYGFHRWHTKIQPLQDELLALQIKKTRREMSSFKWPRIR